MPDSLDQQLMRARERLRTKQKLDAMLTEAQNALYRDASRCRAYQEQLAAEQRDVDRLEATSLTGLFYAVLGTKEERLDKERQELLAAKLKYDEAVESCQASQQEVKRLQSQLESLTDAADAYQRLIDIKESALRETGDQAAARLLQLSEELADLQADVSELNEAIDAGEAARRMLRNVSDELRSAANWGTFDLVGGGLLSSMAKHSRIDAARSLAHQVQRQLRRFEAELADADRRLHVSLEIGAFSKFADYFLDGLIADWIVQTKINDALAACATVLTQVTSAVTACRTQLAGTLEQISRLAEERQTLIEQA